MNNDKFKAFNDAISNDNLEEAIEILTNISEIHNNVYRNEILMIANQFANFKKIYIVLNVEGRDKSFHEKAKIVYALINLKDYFISLEHNQKELLKNDILGVAEKKSSPENTVLTETIEKEVLIQIQKGMKEVNQIMSKFIPDFQSKFPTNIGERTIAEIRRENTFKLKTARAFVFGRTRTGKTTTINYLLDSKVFPSSGQLTCTKSLACGEHKGGLIFYDSPGIGDAYLEENLTRVALGLNQEKESKYGVKKVRLIDITSKSEEGANEFVELTDFQHFKEDIEEKFYLENKDRIKIKEFEIEPFQEWFKGQIDFFILMVSSKIGLDDRQIEFLEEVIENNPNKPIYKLFNLDDSEKYSSNILFLKQDTVNLLRGIQQKLERKKIVGHDKWFIVNAIKGDGFKELIQEFADTLPISVLSQLEKQIRSEYLPIINQRLQDIYLDYAKYLAATLSVYPVDYTIKNKSLLSYATESLVLMADYIFSNSTKKIDTKYLHNEIKRFKESKLKTRYEKRIEKTTYVSHFEDVEASIMKPGFGPWFRYYILSKDIPSDYDKVVVDKKPQYKEKESVFYDNVGQYYGIGGIAIIEKILSFSISISEIYLDNSTKIVSADEFKEMVDENFRYLSCREEIINENRYASKANDNKKSEIAEKIYNLICRDMPPQYHKK